MVTKADLEADIPQASGLIDFQNGPGNTIDADLLDSNWQFHFTKLVQLYNFLIQQSPQLEVATTYTAEQTFEGGIRTDSIKEATTNSDIVLELDGTGAFKYGGTSANLEVATQLFVNQQIAAGVVNPVVFTGATASTAGAAGLVPQPLAGEQDKVLFGGGSFDFVGLDYQTVSTSLTAVVNTLYDTTVAASYTITLPPSPSDGDIIAFANSSGDISQTNVLTVGRNSNNIMGLAEDMTVKQAYARFILRYVSASTNWILIPILTRRVS